MGLLAAAPCSRPHRISRVYEESPGGEAISDHAHRFAHAQSPALRSPDPRVFPERSPMCGRHRGARSFRRSQEPRSAVASVEQSRRFHETECLASCPSALVVHQTWRTAGRGSRRIECHGRVPAHCYLECRRVLGGRRFRNSSCIAPAAPDRFPKRRRIHGPRQKARDGSRQVRQTGRQSAEAQLLPDQASADVGHVRQVVVELLWRQPAKLVRRASKDFSPLTTGLQLTAPQAQLYAASSSPREPPPATSPSRPSIRESPFSP